MITSTDDGNGSLGIVFDFQRFSLHDGTGIRTIVFLKGCPLTCAWCSNPEGQSRRPELLYSPGRCIGTEQCERCLGACPLRAIASSKDGKIEVKRGICDDCGECADRCPGGALEICGRLVSVDDVIRQIEADGAFYVRSGGGLTISGGEPLAQPRFVRDLLVAARRRGLDTVIETCGVCAWQTLAEIAPLVDQIFYDIKCIDPSRHEEATGVSNQRILENFRKLREHFPDLPVVVRTPVVPGFNDFDEEVRAIADFVEGAGGASAYELLPYHAFGAPKYSKLGRAYPLAHIVPPSEEKMSNLRSIAAEGLQAANRAS